jgi:hypothetical protein
LKALLLCCNILSCDLWSCRHYTATWHYSLP